MSKTIVGACAKLLNKFLLIINLASIYLYNVITRP